MVKQKQNKKTETISVGERKILIVCTVITLGFFLVVTVITKGSLVDYVLPHGLLGLVAAVTLYRLNSIPRTLVHVMTVLAVVGAISAIGLVIAYFPSYDLYLKYINGIKH